MSITVRKNEQEVIQHLCETIAKYADEAISKNRKFRVGLSGGSLIKYLSQGLPKIKTDWSKWDLFFCDERFVPELSEDSTFGAYKTDLIPNVALKEKQFNKINMNLSLDDCAKDYEQRILAAFGVQLPLIPEFDVLLLGMGPDGHTCSLFPGHPLLSENGKLIAPILDSPKPPPQRITMTYKLINNAAHCIIAVCGSGKSEMVKRILGKNKEPLPIGLVKPKNSPLEWILDEEAHSHLAKEQ